MGASSRFCQLVLSLGFLAVGGCVTHTPMSETVIFHTPQTTPRSTNLMSRGVTLTVSPTGNFGKGLYAPVYRDSRYDDAPMTSDYSVGYYFTSYDPTGRVAFSVTAGLGVAGVDATLKLARRTYAVAGASMPGNAQAWVMHRTYNGPQASVAVGGGVSHQVIAFQHPNPSPYAWYPSTIERTVDVVGVRGYAISHLRTPAKGVQLGTMVGYAPALNQMAATVSLSVGSF